MQIGFNVETLGLAEPAAEAVPWPHVLEQARLAEELGFDVIGVPDHLLYETSLGPAGAWEGISTAAAICALTERARITHAMINTPYRPPTIVAKAAATLDAISGGRYELGLGAGNTDDYQAVGVPADRRYSRFAEAIAIIHGLLRDGRADVHGDFWSARDFEMVSRGPRVEGPPIVLAAWGPRMMRLAAQYADRWNGWTRRSTDRSVWIEMVEALERACVETGRDPATLPRSADLNVAPTIQVPASSGMSPLTGNAEQIAEQLLGFADLDVDEVRLYVISDDTTAGRIGDIEAMADVVSMVHAG